MALLDGIDGCALIGMVHLLPLPGSPSWGGDVAAVRARARADAETLLKGGCDAVIVENMGDVPYLNGSVGPDTLACMTLCVSDVVSLGAAVGVQILAGANGQALAVAGVTGAAFIRAEGFAYGHLADEGWMQASAGPLLRQRARSGLAHVEIWADIQKKHASHAVSADLTLEALASGHRFCGADVLIVTGSETGQPTPVSAVAQAARAGLPVAVGSGVTPTNAALLAPEAQALIVGSSLKRDGDWRRPVDLARVRALRGALDRVG